MIANTTELPWWGWVLCAMVSLFVQATMRP